MISDATTTEDTIQESEILSDEEMLAGLEGDVRETWVRWLAEEKEARESRKRKARLRQFGTPKAMRRTRPLSIGEERGTSRTLAVRLPRWVEEQIREAFEELDGSGAARASPTGCA
jgi:hypothetical protein